MKFRTALLWLALLATVTAGLMVAATWLHHLQDGLQEGGKPRPGPLSILFFFWWGGIFAAGSPLVYLYLWRRTRGTPMEDGEGF